MSDSANAKVPNVPSPKLSPLQCMERVGTQTMGQSTSAMSCSGTLYAGFFFDGTGNNERADYLDVLDQPQKQKHSNVVRLYHTYPDKKADATNKYFAYYIPGVGTPFKEVGDDGGDLGNGFARLGEARMIWALIQVFNAVSQYSYNDLLINDALAKTIATSTGGIGSSGWQRNMALKDTWQPRLEAAIAGFQPKLDAIVIDLFGFSRGAAQARAWANWLFGLCQQKGSEPATAQYLFAGIPLKIRFMGIFDTVASVGVSGTVADTFLESDGHHGWAANNLQIHPAIAKCVHYVAAQEVRASFPLDTVRIDGKYPNNVHEVVYPGAHSDVGGGYPPNEQGKRNGYARIPGFAMYQEALASGVPLMKLGKLKTDAPKVYNSLMPSSEAVDAFNAYQRAVGIQSGSVESQHRQHMAIYHRYRYQAIQLYGQREFVQRASASDSKWLMVGQRNFAEMLQRIALSAAQERRTKGAFSLELLPPTKLDELENPFDPGARRLLPQFQLQKAAPQLRALEERLHKGGGKLVAPAQPELDVAAIVRGLEDAALPLPVSSFLDDYIHDSAGGFLINGNNEYSLNWYGVFKYRRIYFGNQGDRFLRDTSKAQANEATSS